MKKGSLTFSMLVSFNELAWIVVFALVLLSNVEIDKHNKVTRDLKDNNEKLSQQLEQVIKERDALRRLSIYPPYDVPVLKQQITGLKGKLGHVALIVDRSGSMAEGGRWESARSIIRTWLEDLPIEHAVLIYFNDTVDTYPKNLKYLDMMGPQNKQNRAKLLGQFDLIKPKGNTNTLDAIIKAYEYADIDTIILFTDGFPDKGLNHFDDKMAEEIYALCRDHGHKIPINTVGLGNYFSNKLGAFLRRLPTETGGNFIGR